MAPSSNGHVPMPVEVARWFLKQGIYCVPVRFKSKTVTRDGWIAERWEDSDLERQFGAGPTNIGVLLGEASDNFVDCDLDTPEAIAAAAFFLPATGLKWGRDTKPNSHWLYFVDNLTARKNLAFKDPLIKRDESNAEQRGMLCELRLKGQTIGPSSIHPSGELVEADRTTDGSVPHIAYEVLVAALGKVAACALLSRYWVEGVRHDATLPLAGMLCRGGFDGNQAAHFVRALCSVAGESEEDTANRLAAVSDTYAKAERGEHFTAGATLEEFFDPKLVARLRQWLGLTQFAYAGDIGPDGYPLSDIGNAERFARKWANALLWCDAEDSWYLYGGKRWERDDVKQVYRKAIEVVNDFRALAYASQTISRGNTTPEQWKRHADSMGKSKQIKSMLDIAGALLPVALDDFDSDPYLLNTQSGTLELNTRTGDAYLREHRPDDLLTMIAAVGYVSGATSEMFDEFRRMFFEEDFRWDWLQLHSGYLLTGLPKRYSLELIGPTNAGKSLTLGLVARVLGDYAGELKYDSLMKNPHRGGDVPRADLWSVRKKRLVTVAEIPPSVQYDVALFKTLLSGGDKQLIRTLYDRTGGKSIAFAFALWTSGNEPYGPPSGEEAAYERLHVLWCNHQVPKTSRDVNKQQETLDMSVTGEAALAWMVEGFVRLWREHRGNLIPPEFVERATREVQDKLDPWASVLTEEGWIEITGDQNDGVLMSELWEWAKQFYEQDGGRIRKISAERSRFISTLERKGVRVFRSATKFHNREHAQGVRWAPEFAQNQRVTLPDWGQKQT